MIILWQYSARGRIKSTTLQHEKQTTNFIQQDRSWATAWLNLIFFTNRNVACNDERNRRTDPYTLTPANQ